MKKLAAQKNNAIFHTTLLLLSAPTVIWLTIEYGLTYVENKIGFINPFVNFIIPFGVIFFAFAKLLDFVAYLLPANCMVDGCDGKARYIKRKYKTRFRCMKCGHENSNY